MQNLQAARANQAMPNAMGNVMQQGNAMPPGSINAGNMNINMSKFTIGQMPNPFKHKSYFSLFFYFLGPNIGQQGNATGQMPNNMVGQSMPNMQGMRTNQAIPNSIGNAMPNSMPNANPMQQGNVMQAGPMNANMNINMGK